MFTRRRHRRPAASSTTVHQRQTPHFDYEIHLSSRRTTNLRVRDNKVVVAAPAGSCLPSLEQWVKGKSRWVTAQLQRQAERVSSIPQRDYCEGEQLPFMDSTLTLRVAAPGKSGVQRCGDQLWVTPSSRSQRPTVSQVQQLLRDWYRQQAQEILEQKTRLLAQQLQRPVTAVQLRQTRSKWGHCTSRGVIQYNWLILLAPGAVVDYLVAHECCHLIHLNHSAAFWQLVRRCCPGADISRQWLKDNGHTLVL
ncbi:M48 family metallopeptidase [Pseudomaricurvus sp. HS19]|uniref:M48 family metallopeptidase n=1 Tax=Pseudomaricurvus sp. HS19 TaxID=2692626 RepID=UPI00136D2CF1|nr:SprT family zinc-dependent metalloprotease [Pseudomaricurvus sp. HS19]MYM62901.1 DUF45 domain-containing protein [Pseudomaricurvus sp. HS19]